MKTSAFSFFYFTFLFIAGVISPACFAGPPASFAASQAKRDTVLFLDQGNDRYTVRHKDDIWACPGTLQGEVGQALQMDISRLSPLKGCKLYQAIEVVVYEGLKRSSRKVLTFKVTRAQKPWVCQDKASPAAKQALGGYKPGEIMRVPVKMLNANCREATT